MKRKVKIEFPELEKEEIDKIEKLLKDHNYKYKVWSCHSKSKEKFLL